jgi:hypothetical protein
MRSVIPPFVMALAITVKAEEAKEIKFARSADRDDE